MSDKNELYMKITIQEHEELARMLKKVEIKLGSYLLPIRLKGIDYKTLNILCKLKSNMEDIMFIDYPYEASIHTYYGNNDEADSKLIQKFNHYYYRSITNMYGFTVPEKVKNILGSIMLIHNEINQSEDMGYLNNIHRSLAFLMQIIRKQEYKQLGWSRNTNIIKIAKQMGFINKEYPYVWGKIASFFDHTHNEIRKYKSEKGELYKQNFLVTEPYNLGLEDLKNIIKICEERQLEVNIDGESHHFPNNTVRVEFWQKETHVPISGICPKCYTKKYMVARDRFMFCTKCNTYCITDDSNIKKLLEDNKRLREQIENDFLDSFENKRKLVELQNLINTINSKNELIEKYIEENSKLKLQLQNLNEQYRQRRSKEHKKWSIEDQDKLIEYFNNNKLIKNIAKELERSEASIYGRLTKVGLLKHQIRVGINKRACSNPSCNRLIKFRELSFIVNDKELCYDCYVRDYERGILRKEDVKDDS